MSETEKSQIAAVPRNAYTVDEFCYSHRVSRAKLYLLWQEGRGPRFRKLGKKILISAEAAAEWRNAAA
jgi:hypothetical protein